MKCMQCGQAHEGGTRFCRACGTRIEAVDEPVACAGCGSALAPGARFCKQCGTPSVPATAAKASPDAGLVEPESTARSAVVGDRLDDAPHTFEPTVVDESGAAAPGPIESRPRMRGPLIAAAVIGAVVIAGGAVTWMFLRGDAAQPSVAAPVASAPVRVDTPAAPAAAPMAAPVVEAPKPPEDARQPEQPAPSVADAPHQEAAEVAEVDAKAPEADHTRRVGRTRARPVAGDDGTPVKEAPMSPMRDVALNLVREGERAYSRQDYSTAIANARAALGVSPRFDRARKLLDESQRAQQQAMNSISIQ
ncbi:zinc ribbon domain-containing protein [Luteibacter aegosomatis]|uniref:zinc ribbon domain-containing protein n=1 Tax=Luteibacter aegosomatis TaxID=2911537 RepID=UPI001FFBABCE|nr:zinc ribbon domain-containing protein [Luteibacter aegosomatis]UPG85944.1 zinc ribbon domain-containing protein [Luteibacter aegosomatis]